MMLGKVLELAEKKARFVRALTAQKLVTITIVLKKSCFYVPYVCLHILNHTIIQSESRETDVFLNKYYSINF